MYINDVVFYVWLVATMSVLSGFVAWVIAKICKFIRDTIFDISQLKRDVHILGEEQQNDYKRIWVRIDNIEANKCKGEKDE